MPTTPTSGPSATPEQKPRSFAEAAKKISDAVTSDSLNYAARLQAAIAIDPQLETLSDELMEFIADTHAKTANMRPGLEAIGIKNVEQRLKQAAQTSSVYLKDKAFAPLRKAHKAVQSKLNADDTGGVTDVDRVRMATEMTGNPVNNWIFSSDAKDLLPTASDTALDIILHAETASDCLTRSEQLGRDLAQKFNESGVTPDEFHSEQVIDQVTLALSDTWSVLRIIDENSVNVPKEAINGVMGHMFTEAEINAVFADHTKLATLTGVSANPEACRLKIVVSGHTETIEAYGITDVLAKLAPICTDGKHVINVEAKFDDEVAVLAKKMGRGVKIISPDGSVVIEATDMEEVIVRAGGMTAEEFLAKPLKYLPIYFLVDETGVPASGTPETGPGTPESKA